MLIGQLGFFFVLKILRREKAADSAENAKVRGNDEQILERAFLIEITKLKVGGSGDGKEAILLEAKSCYGTIHVCVCVRQFFGKGESVIARLWLLVCGLFTYLTHHLFNMEIQNGWQFYFGVWNDFAPSMIGRVEASAP